MLNIPNSCKVNKILPKKVFYNKKGINSNIKSIFINRIDKITWLYKLSFETIGISKTKEVEEIEIFKIDIKEKIIPYSTIKAITKNISYPILFIIKYEDNYCYAIKIEDNIYNTNWNEELSIDYNAISLKILYQNIVKSIIKEQDNSKNFNTLINNKSKQQELEKRLNVLENKLKQEKQFNRKVELNQEIRKIKEEVNKTDI